MGRSRRRNRRLRAPGTPTPPSGAARVEPPPRRAGREGALDRLGDQRRTLALYLGGALLLAAVALLGTVTLAGSLAPWVVLAGVLGLGLALHAWAQGRLAGKPLGDEDRLLQTMAAGLLLMAVLFALVAAIVLTVS